MSARERPLLNPVRRRIVRWLHRDFEPHYVSELCGELSLGPTVAGYHCDVLSIQGIVNQFEGPHGLMVESRAGDDPAVIALLLATQVEDKSAA